MHYECYGLLSTVGSELLLLGGNFAVLLRIADLLAVDD